MNLVKFVQAKCAQYGERTYLIGEGGPLSYRQFDRESDRLAASLVSLGVAPGDRVAILHYNSPYVFLAYIGVIKAGAIVVPVNPVYTPREIAHILGDSGAGLLLMHHSFAQRVAKITEPLPDLHTTVVRAEGQTPRQALAAAGAEKAVDYAPPALEPDTPAFMFYTSGTTGRPKGVVLTHRNLYFGGPNIAQSFGLTGSDVALGVLPMVHIFCIASPFMGSLSSGGTVVVLPSFDSDAALEAIGRHRVTWFPGVPTMFTYLLNRFDPAKHDVSSLRMGLSGGAPMPAELMQGWQEAFGAEVMEAYGLTESTGLVTCDPVYGERKTGSIGIVASGVEARLVDEQGREVGPGEVGHLIFRGANRAAGYHNLPQVTAERLKDGWLYTGDHAYCDPDGHYFLKGRESELIITAGYNVYPREIEEVLYAFEGVNEAAVIGVPDPAKGEVPRAFVSPEPGKHLNPEAVLAHCEQNLAPYKMPQLKILPQLPKNPTGKIMKKELPVD